MINETSQPNETNSTPCIATSPAILLLSAPMPASLPHGILSRVSDFFQVFHQQNDEVHFVEIVENSQYYMDFAILKCGFNFKRLF